MRGRNGGHWRISRPQWTSMSAWLGEEPAPLPSREGYAALVAAWLATFGPGTAADCLVAGRTEGAVRRRWRTSVPSRWAWTSGAAGWVLPGDEDAAAYDEPWAALLPVLDPTVMGWKERGFFLGPHGAALFDTNGNAGTTAWWNGRVVGCWVQDDRRRRAAQSAGGRSAGRSRRPRGGGGTPHEVAGGHRVGTVYPSAGHEGARPRPYALPGA